MFWFAFMTILLESRPLPVDQISFAVAHGKFYGTVKLFITGTYMEHRPTCSLAVTVVHNSLMDDAVA